ncbi:MAG: alpha-1,2-fucosyltransferase [Lachnospiraceae bacterium]|nr:alpha-1,2-fucosyltransferase [Lachnospiraceae bacterium]
MMIIKISGGLGNQLQQYALYEKLKSIGKDVKVDFSWFKDTKERLTGRDLELDYFPNIQYEACTKQELETVLGKRNMAVKMLEKLHLKESKLYFEHQMYDEAIFAMDNKVLQGYFACEGYYSDILSILQGRLEFPKEKSEENMRMAQKMEESNSVSIHIRRGDYLNPENREIFGDICTEVYYEKAIDYVKQRVENPQFFIFSDDIEYVSKKYVGKEYTIVDINHGKDSFYDMYLMTCCKHNICANSTFSFWGARLNKNQEKMMIRPLKQRNNCDWYEPNRMKELWKNWIFIDEKGIVQ